MILSDIEYETLQEALNASKDKKDFSDLFGFLSDNIDDLEDEDRKKAINGIWDVFTLSLKVPYEGNLTDYHDSDSGHEYFTSCLGEIDNWNEDNEDQKLDTLLKENFEDVFSFIKKYKLFKLASEFSINLRNNSKSQDLIAEYKKLTSYVVNESDDEWKAEGGLRRFLDDFDLSKAQADNILKMAENLCSKSDLKDIKTLYQERCDAPEDDYDYLHEDEHWTKFSRVM
jgi:hypothetical protein